ncbi:Probable RNA-directed DNA polymerase from transposon BS [Eumeta japonica]|uniref:Probable RNA-directed DNA polymerase from transposon BS n=1 Tax=Eumeta variegata TaxID=151549 RepID=A0A4C1TJF9_EUMVA|nr:Probable RNA-directed DNA polymerase from transposon BS [Eumeta japonica]
MQLAYFAISKAFDCVHHETLIGKLRHYGVTGRALDLLKSYLSNRVQRVDVNGKKSSGSIVHMGVPQGSILGPFLFLVYINDLPSLVKDAHEIVLFADDTSLLFKVKRQQPTYDDVNNAISKVEKWFTANNLLLNEMKTKCIRFSLPNVRHGSGTISVRNKELEFVNSTVFLGITLDDRLQWGPHISKLAKRLSSAAYAVKKMRNLSDVETARLVYFGCFHSLMSYGILHWETPRIFRKFSCCRSGPFAQFTSSDLVHPLEISLRKLEF